MGKNTIIGVGRFALGIIEEDIRRGFANGYIFEDNADMQMNNDPKWPAGNQYIPIAESVDLDKILEQYKELATASIYLESDYQLSSNSVSKLGDLVGLIGDDEPENPAEKVFIISEANINNTKALTKLLENSDKFAFDPFWKKDQSFLMLIYDGEIPDEIRQIVNNYLDKDMTAFFIKKNSPEEIYATIIPALSTVIGPTRWCSTLEKGWDPADQRCAFGSDDIYASPNRIKGIFTPYTLPMNTDISDIDIRPSFEDLKLDRVILYQTAMDLGIDFEDKIKEISPNAKGVTAVFKENPLPDSEPLMWVFPRYK